MDSENNVSSVLGCLVGLYFFIAQIAAAIFFIEYCRTDSILEIIFLDTFFSEIKGLLWIFFI